MIFLLYILQFPNLMHFQYLKKAEKIAILEALADADNNKTKAAGLLGIHRTLLYRKMKQLEIVPS